MNSDMAIQGIEIPAGGKVIGSVGFYAPIYYGEIYSNLPWKYRSENGVVSWKTAKTYAENKNANAVRWGTTYNYWFESTNPPVIKKAKVSRFKPSIAQGVNKTISVDVYAPR